MAMGFVGQKKKEKKKNEDISLNFDVLFIRSFQRFKRFL